MLVRKIMCQFFERRVGKLFAALLVEDAIQTARILGWDAFINNISINCAMLDLNPFELLWWIVILETPLRLPEPMWVEGEVALVITQEPGTIYPKDFARKEVFRIRRVSHHQETGQLMLIDRRNRSIHAISCVHLYI